LSTSGLSTTPRIIPGAWVAMSEMIDATGRTMNRIASTMTIAAARPSGMRAVSHRYTGAKIT
jgi:hypothetical protein